MKAAVVEADCATVLARGAEAVERAALAGRTRHELLEALSACCHAITSSKAIVGYLEMLGCDHLSWFY